MLNLEGARTHRHAALFNFLSFSDHFARETFVYIAIRDDSLREPERYVAENRVDAVF
jgi:hypothetical protein